MVESRNQVCYACYLLQFITSLGLIILSLVLKEEWFWRVVHLHVNRKQQRSEKLVSKEG